MPPKQRIFTKDIVNAATEILRLQGADKLNARAIAAELGCSTQPIFSAFESMDELHDAVFIAAHDRFLEFLDKHTQPRRVLISMICAYVEFARQEPEFFKLLFLSNVMRDAEIYALYQRNSMIEKTIMSTAGVTEQQAWDLFFHVFIFAHGLAALVVNNENALGETSLPGLVQDAIIGFYRLYA